MLLLLLLSMFYADCDNDASIDAAATVCRRRRCFCCGYLCCYCYCCWCRW
jgi:hypothetical protein